MKKNISKLFLGLVCSASVMMSGCIEETIPTDIATDEQLTSSSKATESLLWAMPAILNKLATIDEDMHWDWGYGSIMHVRDVMTEDMPVVSSGYDWYTSWEENKNMGEDYIYPQFIWNYYWKAVQTTNNMISAVNPESANETQLGYLGVAYAFRAMFYLDMAQMFEFLENDVVSSVNASGNNVKGLTVPIVREGMTEEAARNNPRVPREEMAEFILGDLDNAEKYIPNLELTVKTLPHLDVVYGLKARYYMWLGNYAEAKKYARNAINESGLSPMTEDECLSTTKGFNDISKWMFGSQLLAEDDLVKTGILNWASWMSNETSFGYSSQEPFLMLNSSMYNRLSDTDFRKKLWKAPAGTALDKKTPFIKEESYEKLSDYSSVKFRPAEGNTEDYSVGAATAYPLMRVEEMYFIEAEAAAHLGEGASLINTFMTTYRDPSYNTAKSGDDLVEEIVFQKRIELWGEGLTFFDVKRLNMSVTRGFEGTNFGDTKRFNTKGRPAWMNICIVQTEKNNNSALIGYENPDPSDKYTVVLVD